ncbi:ABC transporter substrate-binding protein [Microbacterium ulmi]|uniref:ABC transporter substrate-binding protein n=1 Tax=Microbacterium ulmi TaxID=179095 RepID=A0A7Y2LY99_9MICO|nr:ABC transporter substrate-binding protein [Microbacterium ulmi]NII68426.1 branched-chain amino acid transport system substrate-binding protein [Microbacterium ulmi]NNH03051.1 ABC transporter substrate-binding protein [Microbacterium ulmi]
MRNRAVLATAALALTTVALAGCAVEGPGTTADADALKIGWLLPQTGPISSLGAPQIAALELAAADVSAAGGAAGLEIEYVGGDEAGDTAAAAQAVDRILADGVSAVIGAGSSSITLSVIDRITGAGVVQCSGMNTSPALTGYPDDGLYFRTVPSDILQGGVLAERIAADGGANVAVIARSDSYATGLADALVDALPDNGLALADRVDYDPSATSFDAEVRRVVASGADSIVLLSFDEGATILQGLIQAGAGPESVNLYGTDALPIASLAETVDPSNPAALEGMTFTQASSGEGSDFTARLLQKSPELTTTAFTPYFYDCAILIALGVEQTGSTDPRGIADALVGLTNGDEECTTFADCKKLLAEGASIAYVGAAGPLKFDEDGEPTTGLYDVLVMQADGTTTTVDTVRRTIEK